SPCRRGALDERLIVGGARDVGRHRHGLAARGFDLLRRALRSRLVHVGDHHARSLGGHGHSGRGADARSRTRHDCDLVLEPHRGLPRYSAISATVRTAAASPATISVVTPAPFHSVSRSRIRSFGPHSATSSTSASGTAASASVFLPERYKSWIVFAASS